MSKCQLPLPAPVRFWDQFLNGSLITASIEKANVWVFFSFQTSAQVPPTASSSMRGPVAAESPEEWPEQLQPRPLAHLAPRCCPRHRATTCTVFWLCAELTPLPQEPGREKAWGLDYNKASLATGLSGHQQPFLWEQPSGSWAPRGGTLAKERCPHNCYPVQLLAFPIHLECALCFQSPVFIMFNFAGTDCK